MDSIFTVASGIIQLVLAGLGVYVSMIPIPSDKLPKRHIACAILFIILGLCGVYITFYQQRELSSQISTLVNSTKIQATSDDIKKLSTDMVSGFDRIVAVLSGGKATGSKKKVLRESVTTKATALSHISTSTTKPTPAPPIIENARFIQKTTISDDPQFPYALQVIIQSNVVMPVSFALECDGVVGKFDFFIAGQTAYMGVQKSFGGKMAVLKFNYPSLTPEKPLVITLYSKAKIQVVKASKVKP